MDVLVHRSEAYALSDDSPVTIHDWDWNDYVCEGQAEVRLELLIEASVDRTSRELLHPTLLYIRAG